jgi:hypothetical protein
MAPAGSVRVSRVRTYLGACKRREHFCVRGCHPLRLSFQRIPLTFSCPLSYSGSLKQVLQHPRRNGQSLTRRRFRLFPFRSPLLRESRFLSFLRLLRCFSSPTYLYPSYVFRWKYPPKRMGFPIRKSPDQSLLTAPRSLSQLTTSFIGIRCQGIHHAPFVA